jgi:hypothetical protein
MKKRGAEMFCAPFVAWIERSEIQVSVPGFAALNPGYKPQNGIFLLWYNVL